MKLLTKIVFIITLCSMLFACAPVAHQSGRVDHMLEGNGTVTKAELRELKKLQDQRKQNQDFWDALGAITDAVLLFKVY